MITFSVFTETRSFRLFLQQHINLAFARGFDDNVGRHSVPAYFEVSPKNQNNNYNFTLNSLLILIFLRYPMLQYSVK